MNGGFGNTLPPAGSVVNITGLTIGGGSPDLSLAPGGPGAQIAQWSQLVASLWTWVVV
jgi:hypothetical protein